MMWQRIIFSLLIFALQLSAYSQGFLHTEGKNIVDGNNENFIIRSIGTGNWMIMEGYMMESSGAANTHTEFRTKLEETIGATFTADFYDHWLENHFSRADVDSLATWGFNTIRVAMHYKWFTPPIEEEKPWEMTWYEKGFTMLDSLVHWCSDNEMYVVFDMHGAPGGQGRNADISDYDPDLPSLWESSWNKRKLVALWYEIAKRYSEEPWVGGYDLINETNWFTFPEGNNSQMLDLYKRITDTIRLVDDNHIVFIEGNSWANDFSGLKSPWDDNMVYSFHKYWSQNSETSLDWILNDIRDPLNVPVWLGETGENSNTWYANLISLCERNNVGWSWWPVKKVSANNPLRVIKNEDYDDLIKGWKGEGPELSWEAAYTAVLEFAEAHKIANCSIQYDVIDAMFRQPFTNETKPFSKPFRPEDVIYLTEFDLGRNNYAYFDTDTANYSIETGQYTAWNAGYAFRNDGVDIEACSDTDQSNGYNVGWTSDGEWMVYSMHSDSAVLVDGIVRYASGSGGGGIILEVDGKIVSSNIQLESTGGWQSWKSASFSDVLLPKGEFKLKLKIENGGANLNYIQFANFRSPDDVDFQLQQGETSVHGNIIFLHFNKEIDIEGNPWEDFSLSYSTHSLAFKDAYIDENRMHVLVIEPSEILPHSIDFSLDYSGNGISSGEEVLASFSELNIVNKLYAYASIPTKIQIEDFVHNEGFVMGDCDDEGKGKNSEWASNGDYLDYEVFVEEAGSYEFSVRVASAYSGAVVGLYHNVEGKFERITSVGLPRTGGWQDWETKSTVVDLPEGKYFLRIQSLSGEHNLNWLEFTPYVGMETTQGFHFELFPNPTDDVLSIRLGRELPAIGAQEIFLYTLEGRKVRNLTVSKRELSMNVSDLPEGLYLLVFEGIETRKVMIAH